MLAERGRFRRKRQTPIKTDVFSKASICFSFKLSNKSNSFNPKLQRLNMEEQKRGKERDIRKVQQTKKVLPVRSRERCIQKVCRPPFLQRACNETVREEKRTLQQAFMDLWNGKSRKQQNRDAAACRLQSEQEAQRYLKITLARRKTCTQAANRSFPGDISFTQRGFWLANEEPLTDRNKRRRLHKQLPLLLPFTQSRLGLLPLPCSLLTTPSAYLSSTFWPFLCLLRPTFSISCSDSACCLGLLLLKTTFWICS